MTDHVAQVIELFVGLVTYTRSTFLCARRRVPARCRARVDRARSSRNVTWTATYSTTVCTQYRGSLRRMTTPVGCARGNREPVCHDPDLPVALKCRRLSLFFFSSRRRHTRCSRDWSSDVCSSD